MGGAGRPGRSAARGEAAPSSGPPHRATSAGVRRLLFIWYSPWSIRARWALDHHGVLHELEHYLPMVGEPLLRARLRQGRGTVSVPVLFEDGGRAIAGSKEIARHAERVAPTERGAQTLFPEAHAASIERWDGIADAIARAGRALLMPRFEHDDAALEETLPRALRAGPVKLVSLPLARAAARYVAHKYGADPAHAEHDRRAMRAALAEVRAAISAREHLAGDGLTYADVSVAASLQFVRPCPELARLGPATHASWTDVAMAREHEDILRWRDGLVARTHPRPLRAAT